MVVANCSAADVEPPSRPLNLTLTAKTATSISLAWDVSADDSGVTGYEVLRDGLTAGTAPTNGFVCTGLTENRKCTFRVRARDAAGNLSDLSNALLATPQAGVTQVKPELVRTQFHALVLNYNPRVLIDGSYVRVDERYGHRSVDQLVEQYIRLMRLASGGQVVWSVSDRYDLDEFPAPANAAQPAYTADNFQTLRDQGYDYWNNPNPSGPAYLEIIRDARFEIRRKVNAGEVDAIWVFGPPGTGFWETAMAGPTAIYVNGGPIPTTELTRNVVFYGFGKEGHQGVGFMCENTGHMTEVIIRDNIAPNWPRNRSTRSFTTLNLDNPGRQLVTRAVNDWSCFTQTEAAAWDASLVAPGDSQLGFSHFPSTALFNYNWSTVRFDLGNTGDFRFYDGGWSGGNLELHAPLGDGAKALLFDGMGMSDNLGDYHPPRAFSEADVEWTVRAERASSEAHAGFLFRVSRCQAGLNQVKGCYVGISPGRDKVILARLDNGLTTLAEASLAIETNVTYRLRLEARGPQLKVFVNGALTPLLTATDTENATGAFGFAAYSTEAHFGDLGIVAHTQSHADNWYRYPANPGLTRDLSPLDWNGDRDVAMDGFYAWWYEHLPKNGGGHYATNVAGGTGSLLLNTWWPYIFDINRFKTTCPFPDIVFPPEDVTPPAAPASVAALALGASKIGLSWAEAADNVGVTRYAVYRDGVLLRQSALPYLIDTRLAPNTSHTYLVKSCDGSGNTSTTGAEVRVATLPKDSQGAVLNGGFEVEPLSCGWSTEAFVPSAAVFTWEPVGTGRKGGRCVSISSTRFNDARWMQTLTGLTPGATYWLSGWIKGEDVTCEPGKNLGANLCLMGGWDHAPDGLVGTFDWRQVSFRFTAPPSGTVTIGCRLGFWGNTTSGKIWLDDVAVTQPTEVRLDAPQFLPDGMLQFLLLAGPGSTYRIDASADLESWEELLSVQAAHPVTEVVDPSLPRLAARFYRAVRP
jgi:chitodextrinase